MENNFFNQVVSAVVRFFGGDPKNLTPAEIHEFVTSKIEEMDIEKNKESSALSDALDKAKSAVDELNQRVSTYEIKLEDWQNVIKDMSLRVSNLESENDDLKAKLKQLERNTEDIASNIALANVSSPAIKTEGDSEPIQITKTNAIKVVEIPSSLSAMFGKTNK